LYPVIADHASEIVAIKARIDALEAAVAEIIGDVE
jgi:hypothetical protein